MSVYESLNSEVTFAESAVGALGAAVGSVEDSSEFPFADEGI